jgi:hypothetical protein
VQQQQDLRKKNSAFVNLDFLHWLGSLNLRKLEVPHF